MTDDQARPDDIDPESDREPASGTSDMSGSTAPTDDKDMAELSRESDMSGSTDAEAAEPA